MTDFISDDPTVGLIIASISKTKFCFDINHVNAIMNPSEFERNRIIELSNNSFISFNNDTFPIIKLDSFFNLESFPVTLFSRILLLEYNNIQFAFYVDEVKEILAFNQKNMVEAGVEEYTGKNSYFKAYINYQGDSHILPNFNRIANELSDYFSGLTIINN